MSNNLKPQLVAAGILLTYAAINVDKVADIPCDYTEERVVTSEELQRLRDNGFQVTVLEEL